MYSSLGAKIVVEKTITRIITWENTTELDLCN